MTDELIARLEAAAAIDQRDALISAYIAIYDGDHPEFCSSTRALRFMRMLNAEAYESAALTLVPEGWRMAALCQRDPWFCRLETDDFESVTWGKGGDWITEVTSGSEATANAPTPALAIVIAALRAIEARQQ